MRRPRLVPVFLAAALAASCAAPPAAVGPRGASPRPGGTSPRPSTPAGVGASAPAPSGSPIAFTPLPPSPPVGLAPGAVAATLTGKVKAPASLVSNNGGNLIGNNGGAIVSNNGGSLISDKGAAYGLLAALEQVPAAGYVVELLDGAGRPIVDAAGQAVVGTTDAGGRFGLQAPPQANNWLLRVRLADGKGQLDAVVPAAKAGTEVGVDLVSTLTTRYILDAYVATQADAQATLDKLPAPVEAETRTKAEAALAAKGAVPAALTAAEVRAQVEALRAADPALDAQLEAVKRLLIPAGQRDLGAGLAATAVLLEPVNGLVPDGAGGLYVASGKDARVWRLGPDGRLATVAGSGKSAYTFGDPAKGGQHASLDDDLTGERATEAALFPIARVGLAPSGELLVVESAGGRFSFETGEFDIVTTHRVTRVKPDGTLAPVYQGTDVGAALYGDGEEILLLKQAGKGKEARLVAHQPGGADRPIATFPPGQPSDGLVENPIARDARGRLTALEIYGGAEATGFWNADPADGTSVRDALAPKEAEAAWALDPAGNRVRLDAAADVLEIVRPDGARATLAPGLPPSAVGKRPTAVAVAPDGAWIALDRPDGTRSAEIYRIRAGRPAELVAGATDPSGLPAGEAPIQPRSVAPLADGGFYLAEASLHQVWRVGADQRLRPFAGTGAATASGDGGPATAAGLPRPLRVVPDPAGGVDVVCEGSIRHVAPDGTITTRYTPPGAGDELMEAARMPDGALVAWLDKGSTLQRLVFRGGAAPTVDEMPGFVGTLAVTLGPDGKTYGRGSDGEIARWSPEAGNEVLLKDARLNEEVKLGAPTLAFDAEGRLYVTTGHSKLAASTSRIWRIDLATKALTEIAGPGGRIFTAKTVDDGLNTPVCPVVDAGGGLMIVDIENRQVKRIPPEVLAP